MLRKGLEYSYQSSLLYEYLKVKEHILNLNRVLREVVVRLDGATKGQQTSTEALIEFDVIASIFFYVFPRILEYHHLTFNCSELHFIEVLHSENQSQNVKQWSLLHHYLMAWEKSRHPR